MEPILREIGGYLIGVNPALGDEVLLDEALIGRIDPEGTANNINDVLEAIHESTFLPLSAQWEMLDKCTFKCPFCYIVGHSKNRIRRFTDVREHLDELVDSGLLFLQLTGGECTMHPDFQEIYLHLKRRGVLLEVYTNGSNLSDELLDTFKAYKPFRVEVSIYGMTDDEVARNTGSDYSAADIFANILRLKEAGLRLRCKTPVNIHTSAVIHRAEQWCNEHDIEYYYSTDVYDGHDGVDLSPNSLSISDIVNFEVKKLIDADRKAGGGTIAIGPGNEGKRRSYACAVSRFGFYIDSSFRVGLCSSVRTQMTAVDHNIGVLASLRKVQQGVAKVVEADMAGCVACEARGMCKSCPADAIEERDANGSVTGYRVNETICEATRQRYRGIVESLLGGAH